MWGVRGLTPVVRLVPRFFENQVCTAIDQRAILQHITSLVILLLSPTSQYTTYTHTLTLFNNIVRQHGMVSFRPLLPCPFPSCCSCQHSHRASGFAHMHRLAEVEVNTGTADRRAYPICPTGTAAWWTQLAAASSCKLSNQSILNDKQALNTSEIHVALYQSGMPVV